MTNKEAVIASIQVPGADDSAIQKALLDAEIPADENYVKQNAKQVDLAAVEVLKGMLAIASVSEGGYSIGYSIPGIQARISFLLSKWEIEIPGTPTVRGVSKW